MHVCMYAGDSILARAHNTIISAVRDFSVFAGPGGRLLTNHTCTTCGDLHNHLITNFV